MHATQARC